MNGYAGKILRVNLTEGKVSSIDTGDYEKWGGGHGIGSALFWDLVKDKTISGFDPENVVTIMTSPMTGTLVTGGSARTEVQGIGVQSSPMGWFTRTGFGGRFGPMLKYAGWDQTSGWPTRRALDSLGMGEVADELEGKGRLGRA